LAAASREDGRVEFRVLGPLEVREGDRVLRVGRGKQSALLALLLLHPDHALSTDRLIDELWGERPPPTARKALQVNVAELRKALGAEAIVTRAPTYALAVEGHEVDLHHFERLLEEARAADAGTAARLLRDALALWRGPPLADLAFEPFAHAEIARLEELRLAALEDRVEADLALGRDAELVAELERLVAQHPLRERLRGQLMLALYRCERQAEALEAFRAARRALVEELGIEPGPALQQLQRRVLEQDPSLAPPPLPEPPGAGCGNLPPEPTSFVGRARELADVVALIARERLVTLHGAGGIGKTRLALRAGAGAAFPDGAWLVELAPVADPALVWPAVAAALEVREEPGRSPADGVLAQLAGRRALVVLDNCEHVLDAAREVASEVLGGAPSVQVLATSREPLGDPAEHVWPVPELSPESDAVRLFAERGARSLPGYELDERDRPVVIEICRRLDGLPLAIELAAARLNVLAPAQIAERLSDRFRLLTRGDRTAPLRHRTLRATVEWSYELLSAAEQATLARAAVFAGGFDLDAAEHVLGGDALELVTSLVEKSLLTRQSEHGRARYGLHETIREFAREQLSQRDAVSARHLEWFMRLLERADEQLRGPDQAAWVARLAPDQDNFRQALAWGLAHERAGQALELAWHLHHFWALRGNLGESERWLGAALDATAGAPASIERTRALSRWAEIAERQGAYAEARTRYALALDMGRALDNPVRQGVCEISLGEIAREQGRLQDARAHLETAHALLRDAGDPERARWPLEALARLAIAEGDAAEARRLLEMSRAEARALGNDSGVGEATLWLGEAAHLAGDLVEARQHYTEALGLARRTGDGECAARAELGFGRLAIDAGSPAEGAVGLVDALRFADESLLRPVVPDCLEALAAVARDPETGAVLLGAAAAFREMLGLVATGRDRDRAERTLTAVRAELGPEAFASAHGAGRALGWGEAVERAFTATSGAA
jgi:predicted ATPase/DNA-binding SARP family transcriptional activator